MHTLKERPALFESLRCETAISYIAALILLALLFSHPLFLLALLLAVQAVIVSAGIAREWLSWLKFSLILMLLIVLVNALFARAGTTVLIRGPVVPLLGATRVTLESLCFSGGMGLRLLVMMGSCCLLTYAVQPDLVLKVLGGRGKIRLALSLTLRLFPLIAADFVRIAEAQRCRGVNFQVRGLRQRIAKYMPVLNTVLLSSLERSWQMAESLQARGYGIKKKTCCQEVLWRPRDYLVIATVFAGLVYGVMLALAGRSGYNYYPQLQQITGSELIMAVLLGFFFVFPALVNWGWRKWPLLRLKT